MTTCKEQEIRSRCIIKEKPMNSKKNSNGNGGNSKKSSCDSNAKSDCNGSGIDEKQLKQFKEIAVCMQKCISQGNGNDNGKSNDCDIGSC